MRHSSLSFVAILLFSSIVIAQHHEAGSTPSAPPPSPAPSAAPAPAPAPPPPPAPAPAPAPVVTHYSSPSPAPSEPASHISAPSMPTAVSTPETHATPAPVVSTGHISGVTATDGSSARPAPVTHAPQSDARGIIPERKISGESKIIPAPRIGDNPPEKAKPAPDLRRRVCLAGPCNTTPVSPAPPQSDLRHRICLTGPCSCPSGQSWSKNGCVGAAPTPPPIEQCQPGELWSGGACAATNQCQPGEIWNGGACVPSNRCMPGQVWNGVDCIPSAGECASIDARAAMLANELRGLKAQIQQSCGQDPPAQDCEDLQLRQKGALQRYQMLLAEAGPTCRTTLADPTSLE